MTALHFSSPVSSTLSAHTFFDDALASLSQNMPIRSSSAVSGYDTPDAGETSGITSPLPAYSSLAQNSALATPTPGYLSPPPAYSSGRATPEQPLPTFVSAENRYSAAIALDAVAPAIPLRPLPADMDIERVRTLTNNASRIPAYPLPSIGRQSKARKVGRYLAWGVIGSVITGSIAIVAILKS